MNYENFEFLNGSLEPTRRLGELFCPLVKLKKYLVLVHVLVSKVNKLSA